MPIQDRPQNRFRITVLFSGRGSHLRNLIDCAQQSHYTVAHAVTDCRDATGIRHANDAGIPCSICDKQQYDSRTAFEQALLTIVQRHESDLVVLAGFMHILGTSFLNAHTDRLINIHPSLLPHYRGCNTHARVLADKKKQHGATVHAVDELVDHGARIANTVLAVMPDDTPETLAKRLLPQEHCLLHRIVALFAGGALTLQSGIPYYHGNPLTEPFTVPYPVQS